MRWIALDRRGGACRGGGAAPDHAVYFLAVLAGNADAPSPRRYLNRALGRAATWRDVYKHVHTFAATVLDRVYFLQDRLSSFRRDPTATST